MNALQQTIELAFEDRAAITPEQVHDDIRNAILETIDLLDQGKIRIAEKINETWHVNQWIKKAVLLVSYFRKPSIR